PFFLTAIGECIGSAKQCSAFDLTDFVKRKEGIVMYGCNPLKSVIRCFPGSQKAILPAATPNRGGGTERGCLAASRGASPMDSAAFHTKWFEKNRCEGGGNCKDKTRVAYGSGRYAILPAFKSTRTPVCVVDGRMGLKHHRAAFSVADRLPRQHIYG